MAAIVSDWVQPLSQPVRLLPRRQAAGLVFLESETVWLNGSNYVRGATEVLFPIVSPNYVRSDTLIQAQDLDFVQGATAVNSANNVSFVNGATTVTVSAIPFVMGATTVVNPGFGNFTGFSGA